MSYHYLKIVSHLLPHVHETRHLMLTRILAVENCEDQIEGTNLSDFNFLATESGEGDV